MSSRDAIAAAAATLFETDGYSGTTVRRIASVAGVDPALVIRHFGSKEALFLDVLGLDELGEPPIDGPLESLGERLVDHALDPARGEFRLRLAALIRATDRELVRDGLREASRRVFVDQLLERLEGDDALLRAHLITSQLGGLLQSWTILAEEQITEASRASITRLYGSAIQHLVDPSTTLRPATPPAP